MNNSKPPGRLALLWQFFKAGLAGVAGTLAHYAVLAGLLYGFHWFPALATAGGFVVGMVVNFLLNFGFVFRTTHSVRSTFWKFGVVALMGMAVNTLVIFLGVQVLGGNVWVCQILGTGLVFLLGFLLNRAWTFGPSGQEGKAG